MIKQFAENVSQKEIVSNILDRMDATGLDITGYTHHNIERIIGENLCEEYPLDTGLFIGYYLNTLLRSELIETNKYIPKVIRNQVSVAMQDGLICVYMSVVAHMLSTLLQPEVHADFYIGYLNASWDFNFTKLLKIPSLKVASFHATTVIDGKVLDVCHSFQNIGMEALDEIIYGSYPKDIRMYGWNMLHSINSLIIYFASYNNQTIDDFMLEHISFMTDFTDTVMDKIAKEHP